MFRNLVEVVLMEPAFHSRLYNNVPVPFSKFNQNIPVAILHSLTLFLCPKNAKR